MRIEIYVVTTEIDKLTFILKNNAYNYLEVQKNTLIRLFGGLTEIEGTKGFCVNEKEDTIEEDNVNLWIIYTDKTENIGNGKDNETVLLWEYWQKFIRIIETIKALTMQKSQCYAIDNKLRFT